MNGHFAQSCLAFPQFYLFEEITEVYLQNFRFFFTPFVHRSYGLINEPLWAEMLMFAKMFFNLTRQTRPPANNDYSQLSPSRVGQFEK